jgi:hypothetical protein
VAEIAAGAASVLLRRPGTGVAIVWNQPGRRALAWVSTHLQGWFMQMTSIVLAAAGIGLAAMVAATDVRPGGLVVGDLANSLAAGVILGSGVWPYGPSPIPPDLQSRLLLKTPDCDGVGQCGMYGLASTAFVNAGDAAD